MSPEGRGGFQGKRKKEKGDTSITGKDQKKD